MALRAKARMVGNQAARRPCPSRFALGSQVILRRGKPRLDRQFFSKFAATLFGFHHCGCQIQNAFAGLLQTYAARMNV